VITPRLVLVFAVAVALGGCRQPPRPPARGSADSDENQAVLEKLQGYLDCLRDHSQPVFRVADLYRRRQRDAPPGAAARAAVELTPDPAKCTRAIEDARKQRPSLPEVDAAADQFATAVQRVFTLTTTAHRAVDPGDKPGDSAHDRARGEALQPELLAAFAAFDAAHTALFDQVYRINHEVHTDQVKRLEQRDGRNLAVLVELMMLRAEELVRFAATPWDRLDQLDLAAFGAALDRTEEAVEDAASYATAHPKDAEEFGRFGPFLDDARSYLTTGRELARRARDHVAYTDAEKIMAGAGNEAGIVGSPAAFARAYNVVVEDAGH
jgi:hypothetical protein